MFHSYVSLPEGILQSNYTIPPNKDHASRGWKTTFILKRLYNIRVIGALCACAPKSWKRNWSCENLLNTAQLRFKDNVQEVRGLIPNISVCM